MKMGPICLILIALYATSLQGIPLFQYTQGWICDKSGCGHVNYHDQVEGCERCNELKNEQRDIESETYQDFDYQDSSTHQEERKVGRQIFVR